MKLHIQDVLNILYINVYKTYLELDMICDLTYGAKISELYQAALSALDYHMDLEDILQLSLQDMFQILVDRCEEYDYNHKFKIIPEKIIFEIK